MFAKEKPYIEQPIEEIRAWREKATRDRRQIQGRNNNNNGRNSVKGIKNRQNTEQNSEQTEVKQ